MLVIGKKPDKLQMGYTHNYCGLDESRLAFAILESSIRSYCIPDGHDRNPSVNNAGSPVQMVELDNPGKRSVLLARG